MDLVEKRELSLYRKSHQNDGFSLIIRYIILKYNVVIQN